MAERKTPYELFGVECGEGWKHLYGPLIDLCKLYNIPVLQVKEKFGGLRFYIGGDKDAPFDIDHLIAAAEEASHKTCEDCGERGQTLEKREDGGIRWVNKVTTGPSETSNWLRSLCKGCREKWDASRTRPPNPSA